MREVKRRRFTAMLPVMFRRLRSSNVPPGRPAGSAFSINCPDTCRQRRRKAMAEG